MKPVKAWAGVTDGALDLEVWPHTGNDEYCRLYRTRKDALRYYQQAVRVLVIAADDVHGAQDG